MHWPCDCCEDQLLHTLRVFISILVCICFRSIWYIAFRPQHWRTAEAKWANSELKTYSRRLTYCPNTPLWASNNAVHAVIALTRLTQKLPWHQRHDTRCYSSKTASRSCIESQTSSASSARLCFCLRQNYLVYCVYNWRLKKEVKEIHCVWAHHMHFLVTPYTLLQLQ